MFIRNVKMAVILLCMISPFAAPAGVFAQTTVSQQLEDQKTQLERQLADIEKQIAEYEQQLTGIQSQKNTLANKIKQLKTQSAALALKIKQTGIEIEKTAGEIRKTQSSIDQNNEKIASLKDKIGALIRTTYEQDRRSLTDVVFSQTSFSGMFSEIRNIEILNQGLADILNQIKARTVILRDTRQQLADKKEEQQSFAAIIKLQNQQLAGSIADENSLLKKTKGKESEYQAALKDTKKKAAEIRGRIYDLFNVGKQITFGEAVQIAQWASAHSGVRAAFLLAILTQESNLGKNVGTCNRAGDPASKGWRVIMKPTRDQEPFKEITRELGLNPDITPVSCPMRDSKGNQMGWGGAMGPAQFIPSTWMGYKDKVAALTGKPADPWDIRDAFLASGLKLKEGGAGTQDGEWAAAMRYFSGSTNLKYRFYGDNVAVLAAQYQNDINDLNK